MAEFERLHVGNSEVQEKQSIAFDFAQTATVGLAATGVLAGLLVNQTSTASGSVVIGAGAGVVGSTVGAGASEAINPGDVTFNVLTANPVGGLPRNDIMVWDSTTKAFGVVVGTPNATPSDPSVANTKLPLGRLRHAASATTIPLAKIDDLRVFTGLRGATVVTWTTSGDIYVTVTGGTCHGPITVPAVSYATRVYVEVEGVAGNNGSGASDVAVSLVGSITPTQRADHPVTAASLKWSSVACSGYMDVPANTSATITVVAALTVPSWFAVGMTLTRVNN